MSFQSILLVAMALLPLLVSDVMSASQPSESLGATSPARLAASWAPQAGLQQECDMTVAATTAGEWIARLHGHPGTGVDQLPDTIADCLGATQRTQKAITADFSVAPAEAQGRQIHF